MSDWTRPQMMESEITYHIEWYKNDSRKGWLSNTDSYNVELIHRLKELGFTVGEPRGTNYYSTARMAEDGLVGIYREAK